MNAIAITALSFTMYYRLSTANEEVVPPNKNVRLLEVQIALSSSTFDNYQMDFLTSHTCWIVLHN